MELLIDGGKDARTNLPHKFLIQRVIIDLAAHSALIMYQHQVFDINGVLYSVKDCQINVVNIAEQSHIEKIPVLDKLGVAIEGQFEDKKIVDLQANPMFDLFIDQYGVKSGMLTGVTGILKQFEKL